MSSILLVFTLDLPLFYTKKRMYYIICKDRRYYFSKLSGIKTNNKFYGHKNPAFIASSHTRRIIQSIIMKSEFYFRGPGRADSWLFPGGN